MSRLNFLLKYAEPDRHYAQADELDKHLNDEQIKSYSQDTIESNRIKVEPKTTDMLVNRMLSGNYHGSSSIFRKFGPSFTADHVHKFLNGHDNDIITSEVARYSKSPENVIEAVNKARQPNATGYAIQTAGNALSSEGATSKIVGDAIRDSSLPGSVRTRAVRSLKAHPKDVEWASDISNHGDKFLAMIGQEMHMFHKDFDETFVDHK